MFAGDLLGKFDNSEYSASWDRNFWAIKDANDGFDSIYVHDMGEGLKEAPVIYIPASAESTLTSEDLDYIWSIDEAAEYGGKFGFLSFSTNTRRADTGVVFGVSLYTISGNGNSFREVPLSAGGKIVPIIYCYGVLGGSEIYEWIGGFYNTVLDWNADNVLEIIEEDAVDMIEYHELDFYSIDIFAYDEDTDGSSYAFFEFDSDGTVTLADQEDIPGDGSIAGDGTRKPDGDKTSTSGGPGRAASLGILSAMLTLCFVLRDAI